MLVRPGKVPVRCEAGRGGPTRALALIVANDVDGASQSAPRWAATPGGVPVIGVGGRRLPDRAARRNHHQADAGVRP